MDCEKFVSATPRKPSEVELVPDFVAGEQKQGRSKEGALSTSPQHITRYCDHASLVTGKDMV